MKYFLGFFFLIFFFGVIVQPVMAIDWYFGFGAEPNPAEANPAQAISNLYTFALGMAGLLAFGIIVYGAFRYTLEADNPSARSDSRDRIYQALIGLLLLLGAVILLRFINPALTNLKNPDLEALKPALFTDSTLRAIQSQPIIPRAAGEVPPGNTSCNHPSNPECPAAVERLKSQVPPIGINRTCYDWKTPGCTSFVGSAASSIVENVIRLRTKVCAGRAAGCTIMVTGATEPGHKSHGPSRVIADIRTTTEMNTYVMREIGFSRLPPEEKWFKGRTDGYYYYYEGDHWHICFDQSSCPQAEQLSGTNRQGPSEHEAE